MTSSTTVMGLTAMVFCTWTVSMAGLASLQQACNPGWDQISSLAGVPGLDVSQPCYRTFRYHWFIIILEAVLILCVAGSLAAGAFAKTRLSWLGMFCVVTLLYIQITDTYNGMFNALEGSDGQLRHRVRTMLAGLVMTSAVNCLLVIALGISPEEPEPQPAVADKASAL